MNKTDIRASIKELKEQKLKEIEAEAVMDYLEGAIKPSITLGELQTLLAMEEVTDLLDMKLGSFLTSSLGSSSGRGAGTTRIRLPEEDKEALKQAICAAIAAGQITKSAILATVTVNADWLKGNWNNITKAMREDKLITTEGERANTTYRLLKKGEAAAEG